MAKPADAVSELFALPLNEFTPARNERAKELAADGDKAAADAVRALRKPSVPAWAVNQVARRDAKGITALFDAFTPLRYDLDNGPLRFVTLAQLAQAWR